MLTDIRFEPIFWILVLQSTNDNEASSKQTSELTRLKLISRWSNRACARGSKVAKSWKMGSHLISTHHQKWPITGINFSIKRNWYVTWYMLYQSAVGARILSFLCMSVISAERLLFDDDPPLNFSFSRSQELYCTPFKNILKCPKGC